MAAVPEGVKTLKRRFVFKRKMNENSAVGRYKARLVVKGFMQGEVDHTYSPVVEFITIITALALAVHREYHVHQLCVRTAFLHGRIDEDVYVLPSEGCGITLTRGKALKLNKALYGQKQSPLLWYDK